jgi:hypothetical protein
MNSLVKQVTLSIRFRPVFTIHNSDAVGVGKTHMSTSNSIFRSCRAQRGSCKKAVISSPDGSLERAFVISPKGILAEAFKINQESSDQIELEFPHDVHEQSVRLDALTRRTLMVSLETKWLVS